MSPNGSTPQRRRRRIITAAAVIAVAVGTLIGIGSVRTPTGPAIGTSLDGPDSYSNNTLPDTITVASFNMHSGRNETGVEDLDLTAKTVAGFDFVGLYEVYDSLWPGTPPQAALLAKPPSDGWLFAPTERRFWSDRFGNALVTRLPVTMWERIPLPTANGSRRNVLIFRSAGWPGNNLSILLTHIARNQDSDAQLAFVTSLFLSQPGPTILMGDLNATSDHPVIARLLGNPLVANPLDDKMPDKRGKHIDWILVRGMNVRDAGTRDLGASDHPLVWADLAFHERPTTAPGSREPQR